MTIFTDHIPTISRFERIANLLPRKNTGHMYPVRTIADEYGVLDVSDPSLRREKDSRIRDAIHYRAACKRIARRAEIPISHHHNWVIEVGFQAIPPSAWIKGGLLEQFADWRKRAVPRPHRPGSSKNLGPEYEFGLWLLGIPANVALRLARGGIHNLPAWTNGIKRSSVWAKTSGYFVKARWKGDQLHRWCPQPKQIQLRRIARAVSRKSFCRSYRISPKLLERLGQMDAEMQRVVLYFAPRGMGRNVRIADVPWERIQKIHDAMIADKTGRIRAAWARGFRRSQILMDNHLTREVGSTYDWSKGRYGTFTELQLINADEYPRASKEFHSLLVGGVTPKEIIDNMLHSYEIDCGDSGVSVEDAENWLKNAPDRLNVEYLYDFLTWMAPGARTYEEACWIRDGGPMTDGLNVPIRHALSLLRSGPNNFNLYMHTSPSLERLIEVVKKFLETSGDIRRVRNLVNARIGYAVMRKIEYNRTRPRMHGKLA